jgi:prepilin-type N-terminal cleavage/methylation domain-containing protein
LARYNFKNWWFNMKFDLKKRAFTLSEIMVTLGLIGALATITIATIGSSVQEKARVAEFKTAYSRLNFTVKGMLHDEGRVYACYTGSMTGAYKDKYGIKTPSGLDNASSECSDFFKSLALAMGVVRSCTTDSINNGCIPPRYPNDGGVSIPYSKNPAYVLENSMILFPLESPISPLLGIDVNGKKGPNKWGQDIFPFQVIATDGVKIGNQTFVKEVEILPPVAPTYDDRSGDGDVAKTSAEMLQDSVGYR